MERNIYDNLLDEFELNFPTLARGAVTWHPSGINAITIVLKDGDRIVYDSITRTVRSIRSAEECKIIPEVDWKKEFGYRLGSIMRNKGLNLESLSERSEISRITLGKYIHGSSLPTSYNTMKLARALECSISELMDFN